MHIRTYVCVFNDMHIYCMYVRTYNICTYVCDTYILICVFTYICTCVCRCMNKLLKDRMTVMFGTMMKVVIQSLSYLSQCPLRYSVYSSLHLYTPCTHIHAQHTQYTQAYVHKFSCIPVGHIVTKVKGTHWSAFTMYWGTNLTLLVMYPVL